MLVFIWFALPLHVACYPRGNAMPTFIHLVAMRNALPNYALSSQCPVNLKVEELPVGGSTWFKWYMIWISKSFSVYISVLGPIYEMQYASYSRFLRSNRAFKLFKMIRQKCELNLVYKSKGVYKVNIMLKFGSQSPLLKQLSHSWTRLDFALCRVDTFTSFHQLAPSMNDFLKLYLVICS